MNSEDQVHVVLCTCPPEAADRLAESLVDQRLAACVNIVPLVRSVYRWQDKVEKGAESLLVIKCPGSAIERLTERILEEHPYDVPEVVALPVESGSMAYLDWVRDAVRPVGGDE